MSDDMVERVARAIFVSADDEHNTWPTPDHPECMKMARAALAAMRDPTEAMKAVEGVHWDYSCHVCGGLKEGWQAMIDEALK